MCGSFMPGTMGASEIPTGTPASASAFIASKRRTGAAAPGSSAFAIASSRNGMLTCTLTRATFARSESTSTSRRTSRPFVMITTGLRNSRKTSRQPRVNRYEGASGRQQSAPASHPAEGDGLTDARLDLRGGGRRRAETEEPVVDRQERTLLGSARRGGDMLPAALGQKAVVAARKQLRAVVKPH